MSLYGALFGKGQHAQGLVELLQRRQPFEVGRFRDAWVERQGDMPVIRIHTRNGGGNREDYDDEIESMRGHPWFLKDEDDDFDCTYADFYFAPNPAEMDRGDLEALVAIAGDPVDMGEVWQKAINSLAAGRNPTSAKGTE